MYTCVCVYIYISILAAPCADAKFTLLLKLRGALAGSDSYTVGTKVKSG